MENGGGFMSWAPTDSNSSFTHQLVDPTVLRLGKRQHFTAAGEEAGAAASGAVKREKTSASPSNGMIPRCQVEGCHKSLAEAKGYHKRHKVCAIHAKDPKVVVLGAEQRFCQQCSRFHAISEFDGTKRSCRRRLAGHNERRRKSNSDSSSSRYPLALDTTIIGSRFQYLSETPPGRALSLLSSSPELSSRSNAALRELIAENRAALLARQLYPSNGTWHNDAGSYNDQSINISFAAHQNQEISAQCSTSQFLNSWNRHHEPGNDHLTLDLMQNATPNCTSFEFDLSGRNKTKEEEEECYEFWKSLEGTHVV